MAELSPRTALVRTIAAATLASLAVRPAALAQDRSAIDQLVVRVGQRVAEFYRRAQTVMCVERSTVQPVSRDWGSDGMARTVESDLRVEMSPSDTDRPVEPAVIRVVRSVNGRAPNPKDATSRFGCTDPNPLSPEPLAFLLPAHRDEYRFTSIRQGKEGNRPAVVLAFQTANRRSRLELIEDEHGHDDCFDWKGTVSRSGRIWLDAETDDVMKVETRIDGPIDIQVPSALQRRHGLSPWITLERDDLTLRYRNVRFTEPDDVLLLPDTIDALTILRSDLQSIRRRDVLTDYRRFLTSGRIKRSAAPGIP